MNVNGTFFISLILSVMWGAALAYTVHEYRLALRGRAVGERRSGDVVAAFRRVLALWCLWLICASYVFGTLMIILGLDETVVGRVLFFALLGSNVVGSLFFLVSLRFD